jgi:hypothetical protein
MGRKPTKKYQALSGRLPKITYNKKRCTDREVRRLLAGLPLAEPAPGQSSRAVDELTLPTAEDIEQFGFQDDALNWEDIQEEEGIDELDVEVQVVDEADLERAEEVATAYSRAQQTKHLRWATARWDALPHASRDLSGYIPPASKCHLCGEIAVKRCFECSSFRDNVSNLCFLLGD